MGTEAPIESGTARGSSMQAFPSYERYQADYQAFAAAVRTKLIREIAGLPVAADDPPDHRARHADLGGLPRP